MKLRTVFVASVSVATAYSWRYLGSDSYSNRIYAHQQQLELQQIQVLFRHGARTTVSDDSSFTNIKEVDWSKTKFVRPESEFVLKSFGSGEVLKPKLSSHHLLGGCSLGELTTVGLKEANEFGQWLKEEYVQKHNFLSSLYSNEEETYIRSTPYQRTVYTAVGVLEGLYGKKGTTKTIPIWTMPISDHLMPSLSTCRAIVKRIESWYYVVTDDRRKINEEMGIKEGVTHLGFSEIHDIIVSRRHHSLHVPDYLLEKEQMIAEIGMNEAMMTLGNSVSELRSCVGALMETFCTEIENSISGESKRKAILLSCHDTTVLCLQKVLGNFTGEWPLFLASIIFELYKDNEGQHYVRVLYNKTPLMLDEDESTNEFVPVEKIMALVEKYRVVDWDKECGNLSQ